LVREIGAINDESQHGGPLSPDSLQFYIWLQLMLKRINDELLHILPPLEARHGNSRGSPGPGSAAAVPLPPITAGSSWYTMVAEECLHEALGLVSRVLNEAKSAGQAPLDTGRIRYASKALNLIAALNKVASQALDDAEVRVLLDATLTAIRPEHQRNLGLYRLLVAQLRQLQEKLDSHD